MTGHLVNTSKFLFLILRHVPEKIGLAPDAMGWADIGQLLAQASQHGRHLSREQMDDVVARDSKTRYAISDDGLRIRASEGHPLATVDIALL